MTARRVKLGRISKGEADVYYDGERIGFVARNDGDHGPVWDNGTYEPDKTTGGFFAEYGPGGDRTRRAAVATLVAHYRDRRRRARRVRDSR